LEQYVVALLHKASEFVIPFPFPSFLHLFVFQNLLGEWMVVRTCRAGYGLLLPQPHACRTEAQTANQEFHPLFIPKTGHFLCLSFILNIDYGVRATASTYFHFECLA
jgi:hypothetical protein